MIFSLVAPEEKWLKELVKISPENLVKLLPAGGAIRMSPGLDKARTDADLLNRGRFFAPLTLFALFSYSDKRTRRLVWEIKYRKHRELGQKIGFLFYEKILQEKLSGRFSSEKIIIAPIPSSRRRLRERGFNQCEFLCQMILEEEHRRGAAIFEYIPKLLVKIKETPRQEGLNRAERLKNINGSFAINVDVAQKLRGRTVFIIDDVITTGKTTSEATGVVLEKDAAMVSALAIARQS